MKAKTASTPDTGTSALSENSRRSLLSLLLLLGLSGFLLLGGERRAGAEGQLDRKASSTNPSVACLYVTNTGNGSVVYSEWDGTGVINLSNLDGKLGLPSGIGFDTNADKLFVVNITYGGLVKANPDGSGAATLNLSGISSPYDLALDLTGSKVYFVNYGDNTISRANLDGTSSENLGNPGGLLDLPRAIALDVPNGHMYIVSYGNSKIVRADLDGSNAVDLGNLNATLSSASGIALDLTGGKMYVTNRFNHTISRANLDGTDGVSLGDAGGLLNGPMGIALDVAGDKLYVTNYSDNTIVQANLDGTGGVSLGNLGGHLNQPFRIALRGGACPAFTPTATPTATNTPTITPTPTATPTLQPGAAQCVYVTSTSNNLLVGANAHGVVQNLGYLDDTLYEPYGIALDPAGGKMYIANYDDNSITGANLDGTGAVNLGDLGGLLNYPWGIDLDVANGKMYVSNYRNGKIIRANLDGSDAEDLGDLGGLLYRPASLALDLTNGKIYVANYDDSNIIRANLDGSGGEDLGDLDGLLYEPHDIDLDVANGKMYVVDYSEELVVEANLDGTDVVDLGNLGGWVSEPTSLALDVSRGKMYVLNQGNNTVVQANLDGSGVREFADFYISDYPYGLAVNPALCDASNAGPTPTPLAVTLAWNTFLGSDFWGEEGGKQVVLDAAGNVYASGKSNGTWGDPLRAYTDYSDGFVAKFNANGDLIWNTFLGGDDDDWAMSLTIDSAGNLYVTGETRASWGSPLRAFTSGQESYFADAYVAKLDSDGTLLWHTFLGGAGHEIPQGIVAAANGRVYIVGSTSVSWGAGDCTGCPLQEISSNGDAFVAALDDDGTLL